MAFTESDQCLSVLTPSGTQVSSRTLAIIMVGLPARGKTYISRKIARYLTWLGSKAKIFNVGNYRRDVLGAVQTADFFDPDNVQTLHQRTEVAMTALKDMLAWLDHHSGRPDASKEDLKDAKSPAVGESILSAPLSQVSTLSGTSSSTSKATGVGGPFYVGIYDATNSTMDRREAIHQACTEKGIPFMFIESICDDEEIVFANIREVKLSSPDYVGCDPESAVQDFTNRIKHYARRYDSLTKTELGGEISFVKLINVGQEVMVHKVRGYLQSRIVYFLMNLNITPRSIFFARHGESLFNVQGRIGGDADLSPQGQTFAEKLPEILNPLLGDKTLLTIWTSTLKRTIQTAHYVSAKWPLIQWKQLNELDSGVCEGMTYEEIEETYPADFEERDRDKFNYRYHGGESYYDLVQRLEPVILELERHYEPNHSIFIIGHQAVLRAMYAYFMNLPLDELPYIKIPLHTVIKLTPRAYGCQEERFSVDVPAVDTHRPKPEDTRLSPPKS